MTEPFRTSAHPCPRCRGATLVERDDHWVCDECDGMLVAESELAMSLREIDGSTDSIEARDRTPAEAACPACTQPMETSTIAFGAFVLGGGFLRCEHHGVWMPREALVAAYAAAGQRARAEHARAGRPYAPVMSASLQGRGRAAPAPGAGMVSVVQGGDSTFSRGPGLAISNWEHVRPTVHTIFVTAYRGFRLSCPTCSGQPLAFEGDRWVCSRCAGSFVEDAALVAMISEMTNAPWEMPVVTGATARACPVCSAPMLADHFECVPAERCAGHGVWFADHELAAALQHAAVEHAATERKHGGWLHRLFVPRRP